MLIVSLTGGIATGKSIVAAVFEQLGCHIHHADRIAHRLMEPHSPVWQKIRDRFGSSILKSDNTIDRTKLGAILYSNREERLFINRLIHPLVFKEKKQEIEKLKSGGITKIFISEAALTIEAGYADFFDKVVLIHCKREIQIERLMERDKIKRPLALQKIDSQWPPAKKIKYADYMIETSGSIAQTVEHAERVFRSLVMDNELKNHS
jgi:dephospho-CoA kinase